MSVNKIYINAKNWKNLQKIDFSASNRVKVIIDRDFAKQERSRMAHINLGLVNSSTRDLTPKKLNFEVVGLPDNESFKLKGRNASHDPSMTTQVSATHPSMTRTDNGFRFQIDLSQIHLVSGDDDDNDVVPMAFTSTRKEDDTSKDSDLIHLNTMRS